MGISAANDGRRTTLLLCALLHAFTHVYTTVLPPLYYQIRGDFALSGVSGATLLASAQSLAYCTAGLPIGFLADRVSRKRLMFVGLLANAAAFIALGLAPSYGMALLCVVIAGIAGGAYHPPANALLAGLYPERQGKAIGFAGMGAALGFFVGPAYAGWRGQEAGWRAPCLELGVAGVGAALLFWVLAHDAPRPRQAAAPPGGNALLGYFVLLSAGFGLRDFAGVGFTTFTALFLPQAHAFGQRATGLALGLMSLAGLAANPLIGSASDGSRRLRWVAICLGAAALGAAALPWLPAPLVLVGLLWFGFFLMASYPVVEAAISESVPDRMRGRAFGVFLASGGLIGSSAPWAMGMVKDHLVGGTAGAPAFRPAFAGLGLMMALSILVGLPLLRYVRAKLAQSAHGASGPMGQRVNGSDPTDRSDPTDPSDVTRW